ncbi:MAG: hypothetical protein K2M30_04950 [Desulfovibrionaceae bacterium]|nr:hypothetical protein [Desulfovibrionaceae bacterium]
MLRCVLLVAFVVILGGCGVRVDVIADASGPMLIKDTIQVKTSELQVSIRPSSAPKEEPRVVIVPIRMMHPIENAIDISKSITWEIWNVILQNEVFTHVEYASNKGVTSLQEALAYAREKQATVLITGVSNSFLDGGSVGTSRVALNLQMYDVSTGALLWSLHQSGELQARERMDYVVLQRQPVLPQNPIGTIIATLTYNMVQPVKLWRNSRPHFTAESL